MKFHRLGKKEMYEFLRILPMSIADLLGEWFENETLKSSHSRERHSEFFCWSAGSGNRLRASALFVAILPRCLSQRRLRFRRHQSVAAGIGAGG